jgi:dTDP-3-amino-2,3,6-trideoxy-4-keto-D-glucose/dTDP-3-amino-3,4,6-trideoxy-alpha-D-glucose/dTDP-2,6-dideoxy-D-kanosamine transaminase
VLHPGAAGARVRERFAEYCGVRHAIGTASGTDALELALAACGVERGDQVATVANAGGYATTAILAAGGEPLYVDIDAGTMLMDARALAAALGPRTRAVVATHLYGRMCDMPAILAAAEGRPVIEDAAQAHGAVLAGKRAGAWGTLGCFSFYPTKNLGALGDGGAVTTDDAALAERVRQLRQYGWRERNQAALPGGRNSRLDEMQAAMLLVKLPHLDEWNARRRAIADGYTRGLVGLPLLAAAPTPGGGEWVAHLYVVRMARRDQWRAALAALGIGSGIHYPAPDHRQSAWCGAGWARVELPETERSCREVLTLPCFPELTEPETERVMAAIHATVREEC